MPRSGYDISGFGSWVLQRPEPEVKVREIGSGSGEGQDVGSGKGKGKGPKVIVCFLLNSLPTQRLSLPWRAGAC